MLIGRWSSTPGNKSSHEFSKIGVTLLYATHSDHLSYTLILSYNLIAVTVPVSQGNLTITTSLIYVLKLTYSKSWRYEVFLTDLLEPYHYIKAFVLTIGLKWTLTHSKLFYNYCIKLKILKYWKYPVLHSIYSSKKYITGVTMPSIAFKWV